MADSAKLTITVTSTKTTSTVAIRSAGRYKGLNTNTEDVLLSELPVFGNESESAFWTAVLAKVQGNV
jgi:hypothetical protein